jgi:nitroreductase
MTSSPLQQLELRRRSVRRYADRPVPDSVVLSLLESARQAPSADNTQPWRFVVVKDPAVREKLARASFSGIFAHTRFAGRAPVLIALCAQRAGIVEVGKTIKDRAMYQLDCGIAGEHLVLRAQELGLGTCWIGWFNRRAARRALGVPFHVQVVALIAVGYPVADAAPRPRKRMPLSSMAFLDAWGREYPGAVSQEGSEK